MKTASVEERQKVADLLYVARVIDRGGEEVFRRLIDLVGGASDADDWVCEAIYNQKDMSAEDLLERLGFEPGAAEIPEKSR